MKQATLPLLSLLAVFLFGCNSKELTRSKAATVVSKTYPRSRSGIVIVGKFNTESASLEDYSKTQDGRFQKLLQDDGMFSMVWVGMQRQNVYAVDVELTDKGNSLVTDRAYRTMSVKMCDQQFGDVTGITLIQPTIAEVQYTWKDDSFTSFAKRQLEVYGQLPLPCADVGLQSAKIGMQLFDDGWRISP